MNKTTLQIVYVTPLLAFPGGKVSRQYKKTSVEVLSFGSARMKQLGRLHCAKRTVPL